MILKRLILNPVLIFSVLLQANSSFSQSKDSTFSGFRRFQLGVNYSPEISYRFNRPFGSYQDDEAPQFNYASGISAGFNFNRHLGLEAGFQYSTKSYINAFHSVNVTTNDNGHTILKYKYTRTFRFDYVELPVKVNFISGKKKLRFILSLGISPAFLTQSSLEEKTYYTDRTESRNVSSPANRSFNVFSMLSAGMDYKINSRMNLRIQPIFRFGHLWVANGASTYLYSGGVNVGLYFGF